MIRRAIGRLLWWFLDAGRQEAVAYVPLPDGRSLPVTVPGWRAGR
jgi:hypothetical protein